MFTIESLRQTTEQLVICLANSLQYLLQCIQFFQWSSVFITLPTHPHLLEDLARINDLVVIQ